jgi:uncharacterized membrane protein (DUF106 family)
MSFLAQIIVWLNALANAIGQVVLAPVAYLPGWLSATVIAAVTGVLLLVMFKYTSNQKAIKRVRDDIKANLLALKLFKDSALVALRAQGRILVGAFWLMIYAIVPMLIMMAPVLLILGQLALWYQARPLQVGEEAVVTLKLQGDPASALPEVELQPTDAVQVTVGPVRVRSQREVCWNIQAAKEGKEQLVFRIGDQTFDKELAVGGGFMRVSPLRPGWHWSDVLLNPAEPPFGPESTVQSIEITYPERQSWTSGSNYWVIYWFIVSMVAALCFRKAFNVNI